MIVSKYKVPLLVAALMIIVSICSFFLAVAIAGQQDQIFVGVSVEGINIGQLSRENAVNRLAELNAELRNREVEVKFLEQKKVFRLGEIDAEINSEEIIERAWNYGREGSLINQWRERKRLVEYGVNIPQKISYSKEKFTNLMAEFGREAVVSPQDAKLVISAQDVIEIIPGKVGQVVDSEDALNQMEKILSDKETPVINLAFNVQDPEITVKDIENMRVNGIISHFSTFFDVNKTNRVYNIKVAAGALDGQLVKPGETFSFNKIVGPRSKEAGYKMAPTILNNEFVDSLGGGVCQTSSTLYNSILLAGLEIVERSNHSLVISYVPLGQDAAVAYGGVDFKFKNNLDCAVVIKTQVAGNKLTIKLFGDTAYKKDIRIVNNVTQTIPFKVVYEKDPTIPEGQSVVKQKGVNGYKVSSHYQVYENGKMVSKKNIPNSNYKSLNQIVLQGTKKVAVVKPKPDDPQPPQPPAGNPGDNGQGSNPPPSTPPPSPPVENPGNGGEGNNGGNADMNPML